MACKNPIEAYMIKITNALNNAYRDAYDPTTGNIDVNKLRQTLSTGGYGSKLPALEKTFAEMKEKQLKGLLIC